MFPLTHSVPHTYSMKMLYLLSISKWSPLKSLQYFVSVFNVAHSYISLHTRKFRWIEIFLYALKINLIKTTYLPIRIWEKNIFVLKTHPHLTTVSLTLVYCCLFCIFTLLTQVCFIFRDALSEFMEELGASSPGLMSLTSHLSKVSNNM